MVGNIFGFVVDECVQISTDQMIFSRGTINYFERLQQRYPRSEPFTPPAGEDRGHIAWSTIVGGTKAHTRGIGSVQRSISTSAVAEVGP